MRFTVFILAGLICLTSGTPISKQGKYIIKFKPSANQKQFVEMAKSFNEGSLIPQAKIKYTYPEKFYNGIAGEFSAEFLESLQKEHKDAIEYIEEDGTMYAIEDKEQPDAPSWGLPRISSRKLNASKSYTYPESAGAGVDVWVVDTGVQTSHKDFGGRAKLVKSFVGGSEDGNGHGTHCSGTIASETYGVAKKANIRGVQVLNAQGSGTYSDVVAGINFVTQNVRTGKTVMSMSLGGPQSQAVDDAMVAAIKAGVVAIVAAGNESSDACKVSPAGAPGVLAVGASDSSDKKASFSNVGKCVGIFAPGVDITSLWKGADGATKKISGTSMACPHVAGVAALYMGEKNYASPQEVYADLKNSATNGVLSGLNGDTVNKLLHNRVATDPTNPPKEPTDPPKEPTDPPKEPTDPTDPDDPDDDPMKQICKLFPFFPGCDKKNPGGDPGNPGDICKIAPQLCEGGKSMCQNAPHLCDKEKVLKFFSNKQ